MFTETVSPYTFLNAALLLPGMFFLCQALALVMRITLGTASSRAWRAAAFVAALVYSLLLGAHVTPLVHTLSQAPISAVEVQVAARTSEWNRSMQWLHWWVTTTTGAVAQV